MSLMIREVTNAISSVFKTAGSRSMAALSILGVKTHTSGVLFAGTSANLPGRSTTGRIGNRLPVLSRNSSPSHRASALACRTSTDAGIFPISRTGSLPQPQFVYLLRPVFFFEGGDVCLCEFDFQGGNRFLKMMQLCRANDGARDSRFVQHPC